MTVFLLCPCIYQKGSTVTKRIAIPLEKSIESICLFSTNSHTVLKCLFNSLQKNTVSRIERFEDDLPHGTALDRSTSRNLS